MKPDTKDSFVFFRSFAETVRMIPDEADQLKLLNALIDYGLSGVEPELPYPLNLPLHQMVASVSCADKRYTAAVENGKKGGAPRKNQNARKNFNSVKTTQNNLNDNSNWNANSNSNIGIKNDNSPSARPAPTGGGQPLERYEKGGKQYEVYISDDGEKRVRIISPPEWTPPPKGTPEYDAWRNQ